MCDLRLTKEGDALLCALYKAYLQARSDGSSRSDAKVFGGSDAIHEKLLPKWHFEDVDDICREVDRAGLLICFYGDDVVYFSELDDAGIACMENRIKDGLHDLLDYLEKIKSILLW